MSGQILSCFYTLTLDRDIALPVGPFVCCLRIGNGFVVKDYDFGRNRSRGILIKARKGEVAGNRIGRWTGMSSPLSLINHHDDQNHQQHAKDGEGDFHPA
jgi:hypothetical protein